MNRYIENLKKTQNKLINQSQAWKNKMKNLVEMTKIELEKGQEMK